MNDNTNIKKPSSLSKFNLLLIILFAIIVFSNESTQDNKINLVIESIGLSNTIDFTNSNIQSLNNDFLITSAAQKVHLTGVKFTGRIINTKSVIHTNVTFEITVNGESKEFIINKISPGNSTGFSLYVPDIKVENARYAEIKYISSMVRYSK